MRKAGYTIVELLFVVSVFGLIAVGLSSMYILISKADSAGTAEQKLIAGSRIRFENLVQDIKYNVVTEIEPDGTEVTLYEPTSKKQIHYELSTACLSDQQGCLMLTENEQTNNVTPPDMEVTKFYIKQDSQSAHPLYHIYMEVQSLTKDPVQVRWETSISSRHYGL